MSVTDFLQNVVKFRRKIHDVSFWYWLNCFVSVLSVYALQKKYIFDWHTNVESGIHTSEYLYLWFGGIQSVCVVPFFSSWCVRGLFSPYLPFCSKILYSTEENTLALSGKLFSLICGSDSDLTAHTHEKD